MRGDDPGFNAALLVALKELKKADRLEAEVRRTLAEGDYPPDVIEAVVDRLQAWRFLDDRRTVEDRASRMRSRRYGRARIAADLLERGAPSDEVDAALADATGETELDSALALLRRRSNDTPQRAARFLAGRGFEEEIIEAAVARAFPHEEVV